MPAPATRAASPPSLAITPMAYARAIVQVFQERNLAPGAALQAAQITPSDLERPDACITARQMELLSGTAMQALDDEALGAFERRLPWGSYGMLARASITAPDLGLALRRWCRHHGLLVDDVTLRLETSGDMARLAIDEKDVHRHRSAGVRELSLVHLLRNAHGLSCWFIDSRIPLLAVGLPFAAPAHASVFGHMFSGRLQFDAPRAELCFDARYLGLPLRRDEAALSLMLQRALPLTVVQYRRDRLLVEQVRQVLRAGREDSRTADGVARALNLSARTLHRQLSEQGAMLQQLRDEVRCEQARELLWRSERPVKQVAAAVGFRNEKSFIRAFRHWTGSSPAAFRASASRLAA